MEQGIKLWKPQSQWLEVNNMEEKDFIKEAKELSIGYFITGILVLGLAVLLGFIARTSQSGMFVISPSMFYTLITLHGMLAFVGWGTFVAMGLTWYTLVKALNAPLHSVKLVRFIYWNFMTGAAMLIIGSFWGGFAGSWVFLYPITFHGNWPAWASFFWTLGVILAGVSIILYGLEILLTIRSAGYSLWDSWGFESWKKSDVNDYTFPIAAVPLSIIGIGMIIATIPFAYLLIYQLLEILGVVGTMDALLAKNLLWWFGHPVVYLILFPVVGMIYQMVLDNTGRKRLIGERLTKLGWSIAFIVQNIVGAHHIYMDLVQSAWIPIFSQVSTYVIVLPSVVSLYAIVGTILIAKIEWNLITKYLVTTIIFWFLAGISGIIQATMAFNVFVHNSLYIVAHFHTMALLGLSSMLFATGFYIVQDYTGVDIQNNRWANVGFWSIMIGALSFTSMWFIQGMWGGIRRDALSTPTNLTILTDLSIPFMLLTVFGILVNVYLAIRPFANLNQIDVYHEEKNPSTN